MAELKILLCVAVGELLMVVSARGLIEEYNEKVDGCGAFIIRIQVP